MDININFSYGEDSIHNLAFIKALFIKYNIESLNISYAQKEKLRKQILKELEKLTITGQQSYSNNPKRSSL